MEDIAEECRWHRISKSMKTDRMVASVLPCGVACTCTIVEDNLRSICWHECSAKEEEETCLGHVLVPSQPLLHLGCQMRKESTQQSSAIPVITHPPSERNALYWEGCVNFSRVAGDI